MNEPPLPEGEPDSGPCSKTSLELELDGEYYEDYDHLYLDTTAGAEEYLREIWNQLGVGSNGYLTLNELYSVCEHIGMDTSEDVIEQLFDKLDNDCDGKISFVEFVDGLFRFANGTMNPPISTSSSISTSLSPQPSTSLVRALSQSSILACDTSSKISKFHNKVTPICATISSSSTLAISPTTPLLSLSTTNNFDRAPLTTSALAINSSSTSKVSFSTIDKAIDNVDNITIDTSSSSPSSSSDFDKRNLTWCSGDSCDSSSQQHHHQHLHNHHHHHHQHQQHAHLISSNIDSFISIPSEKDGYIKVSSLLKLWNNLGYTPADAERLLKGFGLQSQTQTVNVVDFWNILEEKLYRHCVDNEHAQICLLTVVHELSQLKTNLEYAIQKCEQLQNNLEEANTRAELLASEVDEQHFRLEKNFADQLLVVDKKYREQLSVKEKKYIKEKEALLQKARNLHSDAEKKITSFEEQIDKLQKSIKSLQDEKQRAESENVQLRLTIAQFEANNVNLRQQIGNTIQLENKIIELESMASIIDTQKCQTFVGEIDRLKEQNMTLQDRNDELLMEKENLRQQLARYQTYPSHYHHSTQIPEIYSNHLLGNSHSSSILSESSIGLPQYWSRTQKRKRRRMRRKARIQQEQTGLHLKNDSGLFQNQTAVEGNHYQKESRQQSLIDSSLQPISSTPALDSDNDERDCDQHHCKMNLSTFSLSQCSTIDTVAETPDSSFKPSSSSSSIHQKNGYTNMNDLKRQRIPSNPSQTESMLDYSYEDEAFVPDDIYYEADENLNFDVDDPQTIIDNLDEHYYDDDDDDDDGGREEEEEEKDQMNYLFKNQGQYFQNSLSRRHHCNRHIQLPLHQSLSLSEEIEWAQNKEAYEKESKDYEIIRETVEKLFMNSIRSSSHCQDSSLKSSNCIQTAEGNENIHVLQQGDDNNNPLDVAIEDGLNFIKNAISSALINISPMHTERDNLNSFSQSDSITHSTIPLASTSLDNFSSSETEGKAIAITKTSEQTNKRSNNIISNEIVQSFIRYLRRQSNETRNDCDNSDNSNDIILSNHDISGNGMQSTENDRITSSNFDHNNNPNSTIGATSRV